MQRFPCLGCFKALTKAEEKVHVCPKKTYTSAKTGVLFAQCIYCKVWPCTEFQHHCLTYTEDGVDMTKRRWDYKLQAWVLDFDHTKPVIETKSYDKSTKEWKAEEEREKEKEKEPERPKVEWKPEEKATEEDFVASSCEIPPDYWTKKRQEEKKSYGTYYSYNPAYPWEGINRKKWTNTWNYLFFLYHQSDWYRFKWISNEDWKLRLTGVYKPEPKYGYHAYSPYHNYHEGCD